MTPEEFQKLKEAEKAHLRKLRDIKKAHQGAVQQSKISQTLTNMASGMTNLYDEHREMVDRLQMGQLQSEARMEVALDSVDSDGLSGSDSIPTEAQDAAALEMDEEAVRKAKAQALVRQMKMESGASMQDLPSRDEQPSARTPASPDAAKSQGRTPLTEKPKPNSSSNLPEKTIGRMKP